MSWPVVDLKSVCDIQMGSAPKGETYVALGKGIPLVAGAADYGDIYPKPKKSTTVPTKLCEKGDLIICVRATVGDLNWADKEYCLGRGVAGLRVTNELNSTYLYYFIKAYEHELYRQATGSTFPQINRKILEQLQVPLPPLSIQKQIAEVLEKADTLRGQCQQMEQELNNFAQSLFLDMFGDGFNSIELGSQLSVVTSGSRGWAKYYSEHGARFIRSLDVQMNYIGSKDIAYVNAPKGKESERAKVQHGDVLLTITGSRIGRVCWVTPDINEAYISQHVALLRLKEKFLPEFVSYFLSMPDLGQRQIQKAQYGQTKPGLNLAQIKAFSIPEVSLNKQKEFLKAINKNNEIRKFNGLYETHIGSLFNSLMQRAFKGELKLKDVA